MVATQEGLEVSPGLRSRFYHAYCWDMLFTETGQPLTRVGCMGARRPRCKSQPFPTRPPPRSSWAGPWTCLGLSLPIYKLRAWSRPLCFGESTIGSSGPFPSNTHTRDRDVGRVGLMEAPSHRRPPRREDPPGSPYLHHSSRRPLPQPQPVEVCQSPRAGIPTSQGLPGQRPSPDGGRIS